MGTFEIILLIIIGLLWIYLLIRPSRVSIEHELTMARLELKECLEVLSAQQRTIDGLEKDSVTDMNIIQQHMSTIQSLETQVQLLTPNIKNNKND
jgi:hypothetical protein